MRLAAKGPLGMAKSRVLSEETLTRVRQIEALVDRCGSTMLRPSCETFDSASPSKTKALQAQLRPYAPRVAAVREVALLKRPSPELIAKNFKKQVLKEVEEQLVHRLTNTKPSRAFRYVHSFSYLCQ